MRLITRTGSHHRAQHPGRRGLLHGGHGRLVRVPLVGAAPTATGIHRRARRSAVPSTVSVRARPRAAEGSEPVVASTTDVSATVPV